MDPLASERAVWLGAALGTALLAAVLAAGVGLAFATHGSGAAWAWMAPAVCDEYCEASHRCGPPETRPVVQQPLNSASNLAYAFVGLVAWRRRPSPLAGLFAASCILLAAGSFLFHAAVARPFQWLDMVGTYAVVVALVAAGAHAAFGVPERIAVGAALAVDAAIAVFKWRLDANVVLPLLLLAASLPIALLVRGGRLGVRVALVPLGLLAVAFALRQLDVAHVLCWPESRLFQGHALWHVLTAASLLASWRLLEANAKPPEMRA